MMSIKTCPNIGTKKQSILNELLSVVIALQWGKILQHKNQQTVCSTNKGLLSNLRIFKANNLIKPVFHLLGLIVNIMSSLCLPACYQNTVMQMTSNGM